MGVLSRLFRVCGLILAVGTLVSFSSLTAQAQIKIFVQAAGIPGESVDAQHKGWIDVAACSDGIILPVIISGGGGGAWKAVFSPVRILKAVDKSSPTLRQMAASGRIITRVIIDFVRSFNEMPLQYLEIELGDVYVSEMSMTTQIPDVSQEAVAFEFTTIRMTYTEYDAYGGKRGQTEFTWNRATNSK